MTLLAKQPRWIWDHPCNAGWPMDSKIWAKRVDHRLNRCVAKRISLKGFAIGSMSVSKPSQRFIHPLKADALLYCTLLITVDDPLRDHYKHTQNFQIKMLWQIAIKRKIICSAQRKPFCFASSLKSRKKLLFWSIGRNVADKPDTVQTVTVANWIRTVATTWVGGLASLCGSGCP